MNLKKLHSNLAEHVYFIHTALICKRNRVLVLIITYTIYENICFHLVWSYIFANIKKNRAKHSTMDLSTTMGDFQVTTDDATEISSTEMTTLIIVNVIFWPLIFLYLWLRQQELKEKNAFNYSSQAEELEPSLGCKQNPAPTIVADPEIGSDHV